MKSVAPPMKRFFQPPAVAKKAKGPTPKKQTLRGKGQKKKVSLKFTIDCTHPAEDNIMDVANFEKYKASKPYRPE